MSNSTGNMSTTTKAMSFNDMVYDMSLNFQRNVNYFVMPCICIIGVAFNLFCCYVFLHSSFRTKMYRLLFWVSFFHASALSIMIFLPIITTKNWYYAFSLSTAVYRLVFRPWLHNTLSMCALMCNLAVSWDRYILVSRKCNCFCSRIPHFALAVAFFFISAPCFMFVFFAYYIGNKKNPQLPDEKFYTLIYSDFGKSQNFNIVRIIMFGIRDLVAWIVFVIINTLLVLETKKHFNKKKRLVGAQPSTLVPSVVGESTGKKADTPKKSETEKAENRVTMMVLYSSIVLIIGRVPNMVQILFFIFNPITGINIFVFNICAILLFSSYTVQIFIYYFFDKNFNTFVKNNVFKKLFCRR